MLKYKNINAFWFYSSRAERYMMGKGMKYEKASKLIYNFKKYGSEKKYIKYLIDQHAKLNNINCIVPLPASTGRLNCLQKLYGVKIRRIKKVCPKKDTHNKELSNKNINSLVIYHELIRENNILLVDDICKTGATMEYFKQKLNFKNIFMLTLGISEKCKGVIGEEELIFL